MSMPESITATTTFREPVVTLQAWAAWMSLPTVPAYWPLFCRFHCDDRSGSFGHEAVRMARSGSSLATAFVCAAQSSTTCRVAPGVTSEKNPLPSEVACQPGWRTASGPTSTGLPLAAAAPAALPSRETARCPTQWSIRASTECPCQWMLLKPAIAAGMTGIPESNARVSNASGPLSCLPVCSRRVRRTLACDHSMAGGFRARRSKKSVPGLPQRGP